MKNTTKFRSFTLLVNRFHENRTSAAIRSRGTLFLVFLSLLVASSAVPSHAQSVGSRELPWASDGNYSTVEIKSSCQASGSKQASWLTEVRNTSDAAIQVKAMGKSMRIDANSSIQLDAVNAKNCNKALRLKLDARAIGDRDHYLLDYNNGSVKAHFKTHTDWMGVSTAIMAGVAAGMGQPIAIPDPPAANPGDGLDDDQ